MMDRSIKNTTESFFKQFLLPKLRGFLAGAKYMSWEESNFPRPEDLVNRFVSDLCPASLPGKA